MAALAELPSQNDFGVDLFFDQEAGAEQLEILLLGCFTGVQHKGTNALALRVEEFVNL